MMGPAWRKFAGATLPALLTVLLAIALWAYSRSVYASGATPATAAAALPSGGGGYPPGALVGWLMALFVIAPTLLVLWIAAAPPLVFPVPRISFAYVLLVDVAGLLLLAIGAGEARVPLADVGALYLLLAAWIGACAALAAFLRRWGAGWSAALPLTLAGLCMAAPVAAMPAIHAAPAAGPLSQPHLIALTTHACPMLAAIDALGAAGPNPASPHLDWGTLPLMYRYSGLGQSIPAQLPRWWIVALLYGSAALVLGTLARARRPSPVAPDSPMASPAAAA
ncbi:MAG TPA: hypothetical protein VH253_09800 [Phycisphaerae bacterium]|nr:hypothetical protein [Phycisphaerae bacterium]